jgi:hypothetical protein
MTRRTHSPTLSPADRAHLRVLNEEARLRRVERLYAAGDYKTAMLIECMEGDSYYTCSPLRNQADNWEQCELQRMNATRCVDRIVFHLPPSAYEAKRLWRYACTS